MFYDIDFWKTFLLKILAEENDLLKSLEIASNI